MTDDAKRNVSVETVNIQPDVLDTKLVWLLGVMCMLLLFVVAVLLEAWYDVESLAERQRTQTQPSQALLEMRQRQEQQLTYRWVDKEHHIAAIPIAEAMKSVQRELVSPPASEPAAPIGEDAR